MKKNCIIFACSINDVNKMNVLNDFLTVFDTHFNNTDIFIGINYSSILEINDRLQEFKNNNKNRIVLFDRVTEESLYSYSDASAYQSALLLLKQSKRKYNYYWFVHTKGAYNSYSNYLRSWYIEKFLKRNIEIITIIESIKSSIGSYGILTTINDNEYANSKNLFFMPFKYIPVNFFYLHSIYLLTSNSMNVFLNNIDNEWFNTKLDKYYFEGTFPMISSGFGFYPYVENRFSNNNYDIYERQKLWLDINGLNKKYKNITNNFRSNYYYEQLTPPL